MSARPFDPSALTAPVTRAQAKAHAEHLFQTGRAPRHKVTVMAIIVCVVLGLFAVNLVSPISGVLLVALGSTGRDDVPLHLRIFGILIPLLILAAVGVGLYFLVRLLVRGPNLERWWRLNHFAQANGMTWFPVSTNPPLPGMIFSQGSARTTTDIVRGEKPRLVEFGNHSFVTGSGKNKTTHRWGYVAVHLSTPLPHIVLDAEGNNLGLFGSNLPTRFNKEQRLSLEGDFDRYFSLYCPRGYEADALYLFTPDIMARFVDKAAALDVEIVDDWLFFYTRGEIAGTDPARWAWLFSIVSAMLDKLAQWERWRDDRLAAPPQGLPAGISPRSPGVASIPPEMPAPSGAALPFAPPPGVLRPPVGVATPGRRLKPQNPWLLVVIIVAVVTLSLLAPVITLMVGSLSR